MAVTVPVVKDRQNFKSPQLAILSFWVSALVCVLASTYGNCDAWPVF